MQSFVVLIPVLDSISILARRYVTGFRSLAGGGWTFPASIAIPHEVGTCFLHT
jgi:hypothetical protein